MGIHLGTLQEGCCKHLNTLELLDLDSYKPDQSMSSVDYVMECEDKFIFIEEKSFLLDFFRLSGEELDDFFKPIDGEVSDEFLQKVGTLEKETKKRLMYQALYDKSLDSVDKVKDTTMIMCEDEDFCTQKVKQAVTFYLYCKSNSPIDTILKSIFNIRQRGKNTMKYIECQELTQILETKGCV